MWFILIFALSTLAIPIAFEIHHRGRDNILTRSGEELLRLSWVRGVSRFFGEVRAWTVAVVVMVIAYLAFAVVWKLISSLARLLF